MSLLIATTVLYYIAMLTSFTGIAFTIFQYVPTYAPMIVYPAIISAVLAFAIKYMIAAKKEELMKQMVEQYQNKQNPAVVAFEETDETTQSDKKTFYN